MRGKRLLALTAALLGSAVLTPVTALAAGPITCSALVTFLETNSFVTQTLSDNQGLASPTATIVPATATNAAYCKVHFQYSSQSGPADGYAAGQSQLIGLNFGLPLNSNDGGSGGAQGAWNGRVLNLGGGGNVGTLGSTTSATNAGWVGSVTDDGHNSSATGSGTLGNFAIIQATHQLDLGEINDFTYEALHQQYLWALALTKQYYGQPAQRNYWYGCSTGGRQGLALAEKYGGDFDGIIAGAPAAYNTEFLLAAGWGALVNRDDVVGAGHPAITAAQYDLANAHAIAACDVMGTDTVADGVIDDPRQCGYTASGDTSLLAAPTGTCTGANCLDSVQAAAIDKIWDGPRNKHGVRIWHPWQKGTPTGALFNIGPTIPTGLGIGQGTAWAEKDLTYASANVYSSVDLAAANLFGEPRPIALEDAMRDSDQPGGMDNYMGIIDFPSIITAHNAGPKQNKIIMWQGSADPNIFPGDSINIYRTVATAYGNGTADFAKLSSWFRYYHAPGVAHCGGGVGANPLTTLPDGNPQIVDDLVNWVENGVVPQSAGDSTHMGILATGPGTFGTRPVCPWPTTAIYNGSGSTMVASNYHCGGNLDANVATVCFGLHTKFGEETSSATDWQSQGAPNPSACN
jgi:Tannase and feruloyl esterase